MNERILAQFSYNPITGILSRNGKPYTAVCSSTGYIYMNIGRKKQNIHRFIWLLMMGEWPNVIDHVNRDRLDNRWSNLRNVSHSENSYNRPRGKNNKSGLKGVCWDTNHSRWKVYINLDGKQVGLLNTKDFFEACCVRKSAENKSGFIF